MCVFVCLPWWPEVVLDKQVQATALLLSPICLHACWFESTVPASFHPSICSCCYHKHVLAVTIALELLHCLGCGWETSPVRQVRSQCPVALLI